MKRKTKAASVRPPSLIGWNRKVSVSIDINRYSCVQGLLNVVPKLISNDGKQLKHVFAVSRSMALRRSKYCWINLLVSARKGMDRGVRAFTPPRW